MSIHICFYFCCQIRGGTKTVSDSALCKFHTEGRWNNGAIFPPRRGSIRGFLGDKATKTKGTLLISSPKITKQVWNGSVLDMCSFHTVLLLCVSLWNYQTLLEEYKRGWEKHLIHSTHMSVKSVRHELKLSIWRNEGDGTVILKARQTDTLMKLDILQFYWFTLPTCKMKETKQIILKEEIKTNNNWQITFSPISMR